ncbi:MAG: ribosomal L7Ae/L30e/S12e/Gadd45 family protein [Candidatus Woesearchaeota archaeon]
MTIARLKNELKSGKVVFGFEKTLKNIKLGKAKTVFLAKNCPDDFRNKLKGYGVEIIELKEESDELSLICKRPHSINVISF